MRIQPGNLVSGLTLLTLSGPVVARISFDIRPAAVREWNDESATGKPDTAQFEVNYARLKLGADIRESLSLKFAYAFYSNSGIDRVTGISNAVTDASVTAKISDSSSLILGKQWGYQGGWEGDYSPYAVYWYSPSSASIPYIITGLNLKTIQYGQQINIMVFNPDSSTTGANKYEGNARQKKIGAGLSFIGSDQSRVRPLLQYHLAPRSDQKANTIHYTAGLQFNADAIKVEYDSMHSILESNTTAGKNDENHGNVLKLEYRSGVFRPSLKIFDNEKTISGVKVERAMGGSIALEILAPETVTSWYFLSYSMLQGKSRDAATQDRNISELSLGIVAHSIPLQP